MRGSPAPDRLAVRLASNIPLIRPLRGRLLPRGEKGHVGRPFRSSPMPRTLSIDFVSDIVCPWCVVGLGGLTAALETLKAEGIEAQIRFQPFELNPQMAPEGENIVEHIGRKYGSTPEQSAANRAMITQRAAEAWPGFQMRMGEESRIWTPSTPTGCCIGRGRSGWRSRGC